MQHAQQKNSTVPDGCRLPCRKPLSRGSATNSDNVIGVIRWAGARRSLVRASAFVHTLRTFAMNRLESDHYQTLKCSFSNNCSKRSSERVQVTTCLNTVFSGIKILLTIDIKAERSKVVTGQIHGKWFAIDQFDWDRNTCVRRLAPEQVFRWCAVSLN